MRETMNISLPKELKRHVARRVKSGDFKTPSEYVRELIRADKRREAEHQLEKLLLEGLDSGPAEPWTKEDLASLRREVHANIAAKSRRRGE